MVAGDVVNAVYLAVDTPVNFQPAAGVEILVTHKVGAWLLYDGVKSVDLDNTVVNCKVFINNSIYLRETNFANCAFTGVQVK